MNDEDIIELYEKRSENAIAETSAKYSKLIMSVNYHILGNTEDCEECENDAYMALWNTIPPKHPDNLKTYLLKIARNIALNRYEYNHAKKRDVNMLLSYDEAEPFMFIAQPEGHIDELALRECINSFLKEQSPANRKIFLLRYWYFASMEEISAECNLRKGVVKTRLFRMRKKINEHMENGGFVYE